MDHKAPNTIKLTAAVVVLAALFLFTNPTKLSSVFLIVPFVLIYLILYWTAESIFGLAEANIEPTLRFGNRKSKFLGVLIGGLPVWLLVLQSIGQLTFRDGIVTVTLFILAYGYIIRMTKRTSQ